MSTPRQSNSPVFYNAPSENLRFPTWGDITASEIIAFLPKWLLSGDVAFRFASNGITNNIAADMHEYFRHLDPSKGKVDRTTFCHIIRRPCAILDLQSLS
jgi:hypothetical protein